MDWRRSADSKLLMPERRPGWERVAIGYFLSILWSTSRTRSLLLVGIGLVRATLPVASLALLVILVNSVVAILSGESGGVGGAAIALVVQAALQVGLAWTDEAYRLAQHRLTLLLRYQFEQTLVDLLITMEVRHIEEPELQAVLSRIRILVASAGGGLLSAVPSTAIALVMLTLLICFAISVHWSTGLVIAILASILTAIYVRTSTERFALRVETTPAAREADYWLGVLGNPLSALDVRAFGLGTWIKARWQGLFLQVAREETRLRVRHDWLALGCQALTVLGSLGLSALLLFLLARGEVTVGAFVGVAAGFSQALSSAHQVAQGAAAAHEGALGLDEYLRFTEVVEPHRRFMLRSCPELRGSIRLRNVSFRYPGSERDAIREITCEIPIGMRLLIVGPNGAGKSTLAKLVAGLYKPSSGVIEYGDVDGQVVNAETLNNQISSLFQSYLYYDCTVRENIGMGDIDLMDRKDRIERAAADACADSFIREWPDGYETPLGRWLWGDGQIPSNGQRLRLALARTMLRDVPMYVFDEPTTALDPLAEGSVVRALDRFTRGRTAIFISHRLNLADMVDHVIVLKEGRILEEGSPSDLLAGSGWLVQAANQAIDSLSANAIVEQGAAGGE